MLSGNYRKRACFTGPLYHLENAIPTISPVLVSGASKEPSTL